MRWPWQKVEAPALVYAADHHAATHDALRLLDEAKTRVLRDPDHCFEAWRYLEHAIVRLNEACRREVRG